MPNFRRPAISRKHITSKLSIYCEIKTRRFIYDKCAKNDTKLGASSHGVLMQPREKLINYKWYAKKYAFCPIAQNFSRFAPTIFRPQWPLPIALTIWGLWPLKNNWRLKILLPLFSLCLLWQNGWIIRIPLSTEVGLGPSDIVLDVDPTSPYGKGHSSPHFSAYCSGPYPGRLTFYPQPVLSNRQCAAGGSHGNPTR